MQEMQDSMAQMNDLMGGRMHMMQRMGSGMMDSAGQGMMNDDAGKADNPGSSAQMQERMDMMQMLMDQMLGHMQESQRLPAG